MVNKGNYKQPYPCIYHTQIQDLIVGISYMENRDYSIV